MIETHFRVSTCLPMGSSEWILYFALLLHVAFALCQPQSFLLYLSGSQPCPTGGAGVVLSKQLCSVQQPPRVHSQQTDMAMGRSNARI